MKSISNKIVNIILRILGLVSLIGAISVVPDEVQDLIPSTCLLVIVALLAFYYFIRQKRIREIIESHATYLIALMVILTVVWQLETLHFLCGNTTWDPQMIENAASGESSNLLNQQYFGHYPNTFFLLWIERFIFLVFGHPKFSNFITILGVVNIFFLDTAFVILVHSAKKIYKSKTITSIVALVSWILIVLSPYFVIFYSDIIGFFISSLFLLLYSLMIDRYVKTLQKVIYSILFGILTSIAYFIKPSLVIFVMALILTGTVATVNNHKLVKPLFNFMEISAITFICSFSAMQFYQHNNNLVKIDKNMAMPMSHYIAMGMTGNGGFNANDVILNTNEPNPRKKNDFNVYLIKKRLKNYGFTGYSKFLFAKQINNTSNATFGWKVEAGTHDFLIPFKKYEKGIGSKIQNLYINGDDGSWKGLALINQIVWITVLIGILCSLRYSGYSTQLLKYTIVGSMIFLLAFEGGRSRYLIQFLPYIIVLAASGIDSFINCKKNFYTNSEEFIS